MGPSVYQISELGNVMDKKLDLGCGSWVDWGKLELDNGNWGVADVIWFLLLQQSNFEWC